MINVGEGDSFLLTLDSPHGGEWEVLIDGGLPDQANTVIAYVKQYAPNGLDRVFATHIDKDHIGGLVDLVKTVTVGELVINIPAAITKTWLPNRRLLASHKENERARKLDEAIELVQDLQNAFRLYQGGRPIRMALQGASFVYDKVQLKVLNPTQARLEAACEEKGLLEELQKYMQPQTSALGTLSGLAGTGPSSVDILKLLGQPTKSSSPVDMTALLRGLSGPSIPASRSLLPTPLPESAAETTSAENDSSIVIEILYEGVPLAILTSDAGAAVLNEVTQHISGTHRYDFLKVPHHGSKTGLDDQLLARWRPRIAFIPVGQNQHGHPAIEILELLRKRGVQTYCSSRTSDCRKECRPGGFGHLSMPYHKSMRAGWSAVDRTKCANN